MARLTAPFALSVIRCHIQGIYRGVQYVRVLSYSYVYFDACELPVYQTRLSGSVLSITTVNKC